MGQLKSLSSTLKMSISSYSRAFLWWLVTGATIVCAQPLDLQWSERFQGNAADVAPKVLERNEGGFSVCYYTKSFSVVDYQIRLVLVDTLGQLIHDHIFGGNNNELVYSLIQTTDNGYLISAATGSFGLDSLFWSAWIIKTDSNGDSIWGQVLSVQQADRVATSVIETEQGYVALIRNIYDGAAQGISLVSLTHSGSIIDERQLEMYQEADTLFVARWGNLLQLSNGNIIVIADAVGECDECSIEDFHYEHIWVWALNNNLDSLWTHHYRFGPDTFLVSTPRGIQSVNGEIVITTAISYNDDNSMETNAHLLRLDSDGNRTSSLVYGNDWESYSYSLVNCPDGGVLVAGGLSIDGNETSQNWLFKVDAEGDSLWSVRVGDAEVYRYQEIAATSDGGYILATTRNDWVGYWAQDIELYCFGPEDLSPIDGRPIGVPQKISLSAYPNPFNAVTTLSVELPQAGQATINVYDVQGRLVRTLINDYLLPGSHRYSFSGGDIGSGTYFVRLDANKMQDVRKVVLVK